MGLQCPVLQKPTHTHLPYRHALGCERLTEVYFYCCWIDFLRTKVTYEVDDRVKESLRETSASNYDPGNVAEG